MQARDPQASSVIRRIHRGQPLEGGQGLGIPSLVGNLNRFRVGQNRRCLGLFGGGIEREHGGEKNWEEHQKDTSTSPRSDPACSCVSARRPEACSSWAARRWAAARRTGPVIRALVRRARSPQARLLFRSKAVGTIVASCAARMAATAWVAASCSRPSGTSNASTPRQASIPRTGITIAAAESCVLLDDHTFTRSPGGGGSVVISACHRARREIVSGG